MSNVILGIDPGIATTGYGVIELKKKDLRVVDFGVIKTSPSAPFPNRLATLEKGLKKILKIYKPKKVAVEELFFYKNTKTAIIVGEARGVILLTLSKEKIPILEFTPLEVKQALTTYGRADKKQVQYMIKSILKLNSLPRQDDAADALGIAICAAWS